MVRINKPSLYGKIDLDDAASIRRVMVAMDYQLSNSVMDSLADEIRALTGLEKRETSYWQSKIRDYQIREEALILKVTVRFEEARHGNDAEVLAAAREMEVLATEVIFTDGIKFGEEYTAVEAVIYSGAATDTYLRGKKTLFERACQRFLIIKTMLTLFRLLAHMVTKALLAQLEPSWRHTPGN